jgi:phosphoribosylamine--glycine ligase
MKVLVVGGGGREHALVWRLAQCKRVDEIFCAPGNAGIAELAQCVDINPLDFEALLEFVKYNWVDLTIVGPEEPLARGLADRFQKEGRKVFGPTSEGARLEASKVFSKDFMKRWGIPTAEYRVFTSCTHAEEYVRLKGTPIVIKADGLAAGKGVFVAQSFQEAQEALRLIMKERAFGEAGQRVVLEECLEGEEASFMAFTDGKDILPMVSSQDHKRVFDGDQGPNTGGMGAYSPAPVVSPEVEARIMQEVMLPFLRGLRQERIPYRGVIYAGLMIKDGRPKVLEFNCRFGDPEAQAVLPRLQTDLFEVALATAEGRLGEIKELQWRPEAAVCVVMASGGYPGKYDKGKPITGLQEAQAIRDVVVFHAGTAFNDTQVVTAGGRVLGVTALGSTVAEAKARAYRAVELIHFQGAHYRRDIADRAIHRPE